MIESYHCRHCKSKCPPFKQNRFKIWLTTCPLCRTKYRISGDSPVVEEVRKRRFESGGFIVNDDKPFVLPSAEEMLIRIKNHEIKEAQKARAAAIADDVIKTVRLTLLSFELKEAEQSENYELCAELRDKIKQLET